jgi:hypothetical protein
MIDRDISAVAPAMAAEERAETLEFDLEAGDAWPFPGRRFAAIVVVNYLFRPLLPILVESLEENGVFLYDTFARGNERFNRPRNPEHLLRAGELLEVVRGKLVVVAYELGIAEDAACPGVKQRICAIKAVPSPGRSDGEPEPCPLHP